MANDLLKAIGRKVTSIEEMTSDELDIAIAFCDKLATTLKGQPRHAAKYTEAISNLIQLQQRKFYRNFD